MTFGEAESLLKSMRAARRRANAIKARIEELESDRECISSALGSTGAHSGNNVSRVEQLAIRIEAEREKHMQALELYFELEDKLSAAIDLLSNDEREIIIEFYISGFSINKISGNINYSDRSVKYIKSRAIKKISEKI